MRHGVLFALLLCLCAPKAFAAGEPVYSPPVDSYPAPVMSSGSGDPFAPDRSPAIVAHEVLQASQASVGGLLADPDVVLPVWLYYVPRKHAFSRQGMEGPDPATRGALPALASAPEAKPAPRAAARPASRPAARPVPKPAAATAPKPAETVASPAAEAAPVTPPAQTFVSGAVPLTSDCVPPKGGICGPQTVSSSPMPLPLRMDPAMPISLQPGK